MLAMIFACDLDGAIGKDGDLPWRQSSDLRHFKMTTINKTVVMGRKTWDSLPAGGLPNRRNIVMSRTPREDVEVMSYEQVMQLSQNEDIKIIQANIQCTVILTVAAFFSYFYFINGYEKNYLVLGLLMSLPLAVGLKTGQLLFNILPEKIFRPVTYSCLIILGATLSFNAYE